MKPVWQLTFSGFASSTAGLVTNITSEGQFHTFYIRHRWKLQASYLLGNTDLRISEIGDVIGTTNPSEHQISQSILEGILSVSYAGSCTAITRNGTLATVSLPVSNLPSTNRSDPVRILQTGVG